MKFFCFIPWFFNQIRPKFAEVKKHILSEENYDICLLKTIENHFWTTKTCFSLCWDWISLSKLVLTKNFKGRCSLVCGAVRGSVLNEVDIWNQRELSVNISPTMNLDAHSAVNHEVIQTQKLPAEMPTK